MAMLSVAGSVALVAGYLGSVLGICVAGELQWLPVAVETSPVTSAYAVPALWYVNDSDLPGSALYQAAFDCWAGALDRNGTNECR